MKKKVGIKTPKNPKPFHDYSQTIDDVYENYEDYNPIKKRRVLIVFDDTISDTNSNTKLSLIVTELFLKRKLNISLVFISQSYFKVFKTTRLNAAHYFIVKIPKKRELQHIASNHSSDIDFKDFMKLYIDYTKESYSLLVNDTIVTSGNSLRFRKNLS